MTSRARDLASRPRRRRTSWSRATSCTAYAEAAGPACGLWAFEALRIARGEPRLGVDTDHRTIPNEVGWIGSAVHLDKGCYRGQETVARVHTLGRPPRRLTLLHLDGSREPAARGRRRAAARGEGGRLRRHLGPPPRAGPDRAGPGQAQRATSTPSSRSTACPPRRRSWSTPRSACTCARCAESPFRRVRRMLSRDERGIGALDASSERSVDEPPVLRRGCLGVGEAEVRRSTSRPRGRCRTRRRGCISAHAEAGQVGEPGQRSAPGRAPAPGRPGRSATTYTSPSSAECCLVQWKPSSSVARVGHQQPGRVEPRLGHPLGEVGGVHRALLGVVGERRRVDAQDLVGVVGPVAADGHPVDTRAPSSGSRLALHHPQLAGRGAARAARR